MLIAATTLAVRARRSASSTASAPTAVIIWVPLSSARPSLACSSRGSRPAASRALAAGTRRPSYSTSPRPIRGSARWASGARSPDAPTLPCSGTTGWMPRSRNSSRRSTTSGRQPLWPSARVLARRSSIARTVAASNGAPTPTAWLTSRLRWRCAASAGSMRRLARSPKPVVTPYTASPDATIDSIVRRLASIRSRAAGSRVARAPWRATASTASRVRSWPVRTTGDGWARRQDRAAAARRSVRSGAGSVPGRAGEPAQVADVVDHERLRA